MALPLQLGNDVVDLSDPRHQGKDRDSRFLKRVFSEEERSAILSSASPDLEVWMHWAAKEAAFKTISKSRGSPPTFHHQQFQVRLPPGENRKAGGKQALAQLHPLQLSIPADHRLLRTGTVRFHETLVQVRVEATSIAVLALSWLGPEAAEPPVPVSWGFASLPSTAGRWQDELRGAFTDVEWGCISHEPSARARIEARRALAGDFAVPENEIEIRCLPGVPGRRIPWVSFRTERLEVDLTLSHQGRLVAWAYVRPPESQRAGA